MFKTFDELLNHKDNISELGKQGKSTLNTKVLEKLSFEDYSDMIDDFEETIFDNYWINKDVEIGIICEKTEKVYTLAQALTLLIFLIAHKKYEIPITPKYLIDCESLKTSKVKKQLNYLAYNIDKDIDKSKSRIEIYKFLFSYVINKFCIIGKNANYPQAFTFSFYELGNFANRCPEFKDIVNTKLDESLTTKEVENKIKEIQARLFHLIREDKHNILYPYLDSDKVDNTQLTQLLGFIGRRSDINKKILPRMTNTNFLRGLESPTDYVNECIVGRDAEITKKDLIKKSGFYSRKIDLLCVNSDVDLETEDCGTTHYMNFFVKTDYHFRAIIGKYMIDEETKEEIEITDEMTDLIGKFIRLRSHICCKLDKKDKNGRRLFCKKCFNAKADLISEITIGGLCSIEAINPLSNKCMSGKHKTLSQVIDVSKLALTKFFKVEFDKAYIIDPEAVEHYQIRLLKEQIEELSDMVKEQDYEDFYAFVLKDVSIIRRDKVTNEVVESYRLDEAGIELSLSDYVLSEQKHLFKTNSESEFIYINLNKCDSSEPIFNVILANEDVSYFLSKLTRLIDTSDIKYYKDYSAFASELLDLLYESGIDVNIINIETIVYNLIRDPENKMKRPDFSEENVNYIFLRLTDAIIESESYSVSLSFQYIAKQFASSTLYEKNGKSIFDSFFNVTKGKIDKEEDE